MIKLGTFAETIRLDFQCGCVNLVEARLLQEEMPEVYSDLAHGQEVVYRTAASFYFYTSKDQKRVKNRDKDLKDKPSEVTVLAEKTKKAKKLQADQQRSLRKYRHIDHGIFGKLTIVGHARDVNMQEMLTYELIPSFNYCWTSYALRGMTRRN